MRRFWWVNHKQTVRQEVGGGYLWSPKQEANGSRSQFYENMREAAPGEMVISFAHSHINSIGVITNYALRAPKPEEFGKVGSYWGAEGWLLPVDWHPVPAPVRPKDILSTIRPFLPDKYSPIHPETGNGNQKAYLAEINKSLFDAIIKSGRFQIPDVSAASSSRPELIESIEDAIQEKIEGDVTLDDTEKKQSIKARIGQGKFRKNVFEVEKRCRLTHIDNPTLLKASHIKPWRVCETAGERLDGCNGLLLAPHVDHLFDLGFITFSDDGMVLISPKLPTHDLQRLGLNEVCKSSIGSFTDKQKKYLTYHREVIFLRG
jgi:putative restriction endonuclease